MSKGLWGRQATLEELPEGAKVLRQVAKVFRHRRGPGQKRRQRVNSHQQRIGRPLALKLAQGLSKGTKH